MIDEAAASGARVKKACAAIDLSFNSYLRWKAGRTNDRRKGAPKRVPRKLSESEREKFFQASCSPEFRDMTPEQIVAILAENGVWYGSGRTLYRILEAKNASLVRTESKRPSSSRRPPELVATGPNQVWTWDITLLKTDVKGLFYYAYVVIDIYSRKIVGWTIEDSENAEYAMILFRRIIRDMGVTPEFVHADNGGPMKGLTLVAFLTMLNVGMTYSRPRVSDDNPFIESFFKTVKYHVGYPKFFKDIGHARIWFASFINWYNTLHRHSGIEYVTPEQRHTGADRELLERRQVTLFNAYGEHPERFVSGPRRFFLNKPVVLHRTS